MSTVHMVGSVTVLDDKPISCTCSAPDTSVRMNDSQSNLGDFSLFPILL